MTPKSADNGDPLQPLVDQARAGDKQASGKLLDSNRERLQRMVSMRLDRRLQGRCDPSDVLQDVYVDVVRRFPEYAAEPKIPFFLWLRLLTEQKLIDLHRKHLGAGMRAVSREVSLS